ncbi:meiotic recombination protein REC114 [Periophthalmus magnuspinnatus]|uniref:meiotic recombination protein REC114 n=1 Tax=Periophthalmus magnuspinnatus TaxID=409849 RepID=UPI0024370B84|nr:meiotic recombination protein REC114 [Periophthalmus magnuspinnatus]
MSTHRSWKLKRFARYTPGAKDKTTIPWKVFEGGDKRSPVFLTILDTGYLLVMQGQKNLDTVHLVSSGDHIKVHQKSDNLLFRFTLNGESRMTRLQFEGKSKEDGLKEAAIALKKVMEYLPVTSLEDAPQPPNQTHTEHSTQVTQSADDVGSKHEVVQGLLPMKKLAQYFLGDINLTLPELYHHCHLAQGDLEPILRVFLLDPSFHAFVEKVEGELKTMLQE